MKKNLHLIISVIMALPVLYLAWIWPSLPEQVPMHFGLNGKVDRYGHKNGVLTMQLILTAVNAGTYLLMCHAYRIAPGKFASSNKGHMQKIGFAISLFIALIQVWVIQLSRTQDFFSANYLFIGMGLLFSVLGNYLNNIKPNNFAGFRIRWTLENENNWRKTHHLAGRIWFAGGLLIAFCSFFLNMKASLFVMLSVTLVMLLIPGIYSYRLYRKHNA